MLKSRKVFDMTKEHFIENAQEYYNNLIETRIAIALLELQNNNPEYKELCSEKDITDGIVDALLKQMQDYDRFAIHRHLESLAIKTNLELKECYIQGVRDGLKFMKDFDVIK